MANNSTAHAQLDDRKLAILRAIVEDYVTTGVPVGSQTIARSGRLGVSAATIRNEMKVLEREGFIEQPHTSAGRVPTDVGYRHYVDTMPADWRLRRRQGQVVERFFQTAQYELESLLAETSRLVADVTDHAAVVVSPARSERTFRGAHIDHLGDHSALVSVVSDGGEVTSRRVDVDFTITVDDVEAAAKRLKAALVGRAVEDGFASLDRDAKRSRSGEFQSEADQLLEQVVVAIRRAETDEAPRYYLGGASRTAAAGSFTDPEKIHQVLELLEQQVSLISVLNDSLGNRGLSVVIGHENPLRELSGCTLVATTFGAGGSQLGSIGVVGPTRMDYSAVISGVVEISRRLGALIERRDRGRMS